MLSASFIASIFDKNGGGMLPWCDREREAEFADQYSLDEAIDAQGGTERPSE